MKLSEYSVKRPITVLMGVLMVVLLGVFSLSQLSVELLPEMNLPYAAVITTYPGANPYEVEEEVTKPIESSIQGVGNYQSISSTSSENFSTVIIEFTAGTNMDTAYLEMRERLDTLSFPDGVSNPSIMKFDPSMMPVLVASITRDFGVDEEQELILTSEWVERDLLNSLESISGVANVEINGASDTVLEIEFNDDKLEEFNLTEATVLETIEKQNIEGMIGVVPDGSVIRFMYLGNNIEGINQLENTPITFFEEEVVYVKDLVNEIKFVNQDTTTYNKVNGMEAVSVVFYQQSDTEITEAVNNIITRLDEVVKDAELDADYQVLMNQGEYIEEAVGSVLNNLIIGAIAAIIVLFMFLRDVRPTLIVTLAIPISIVGSFLLMFFSGISLNVISMGGLALGIGMLVDNSIVVIENIYRLLNEGKSKVEAAIEGAKQVGVAITASTLTTVMVFLPVFFIDNLIIEIFRSMALTIAYSLLASLVIALTLVPSLSAKILKEKKAKSKEGLITKFYRRTLDFALRFKLILLILIIGALVLSINLSQQVGFEMMPASDEGQITVTVDMRNDVTFEQTAEVTDYVVDIIQEFNEVEVVSADIGGGMMMMSGGSSDSSSITILLSDDRTKSSFEVSDAIQEEVNNIDYSEFEFVTESDVTEIISTSASSMMGGGMLFDQDVTINVIGEDLYDMEVVANDLVEILESIEGVKDTSNGISRGTDVVRIEVNKEEAIKYGITENDIQRSIQLFYDSLGFTMMEDTNSGLVIPVDGIKYDITVPAQEFEMDEITALEFLEMIKVFPSDVLDILEVEVENGLVLYMPNVEFFDTDETIVNPNYDEELGMLVINQNLRINDEDIYSISFEEIMMGLDTDQKLSDFTERSVYDLEENPITLVDDKATGFASIFSDGKSRTLTVTATLETDYNLSTVTDELELLIVEYEENHQFDNLQIEMDESLMDTMVDLLIAVVVAILLVYMIMAIQFQSLVYPFIVLFTVPLAFTGALLALVALNFPISMPAMIGLIVLTGIIVNNGIVLIDYINQQRAAGMKVKEAVRSAGVVRLRPIFMTAFTTSIALLPMALGMGEGGELLQPLAITSIGGLLYATILTLYVVPAMYEVMAHD